MWKQYVYATAFLLLTFVALLFIGLSGDPIFNGWREHLHRTYGSGAPLPPPAQWLFDVYAYNEGEFLRSCVCFGWFFIILFTFGVTRWRDSFVSRILHGAALIWLSFIAYLAFLLWAGVLPFVY